MYSDGSIFDIDIGTYAILLQFAIDESILSVHRYCDTKMVKNLDLEFSLRNRTCGPYE
jgi:hypothetical protein